MLGIALEDCRPSRRVERLPSKSRRPSSPSAHESPRDLTRRGERGFFSRCPWRSRYTPLRNRLLKPSSHFHPKQAADDGTPWKVARVNGLFRGETLPRTAQSNPEGNSPLGKQPPSLSPFSSEGEWPRRGPSPWGRGDAADKRPWLTGLTGRRPHPSLPRRLSVFCSLVPRP